MEPKMKETNIEWIGCIPDHWKLHKLQFCLLEINEKNIPVKTEQVLSLVKDKGVMLYEEKGNQGNKAKEDVTEYKIAYENTLIVNSMNILIGSVGISPYFGCVSPVYYVFRETEQSDLRFINYIFNTREFQKELRRYANGILEIRLRVSSYDIFKRLIPLPEKDTQVRIADFLDERCEEIDAIENRLNEEIQRLEEYKTSIISEAIYRGVDTNCTFVESGEASVGKIPDKWTINRVKNVSELVTDGAHISPDVSREEYCFLSVADMDELGNLNFDDCLQITEEQYRYFVKTGCKPKKNDILISKDGTIGKTTIVNDEDFVVASSLVIIRPNTNKVLPEYLRYNLMSKYVQEQLVSLLTGTALKRVSVGKNSNLRIVYTDNLEMQKRIIEYLNPKCEILDNVIANKKKELNHLLDYKKSIIYEYVTGKKEVTDNE